MAAPGPVAEPRLGTGDVAEVYARQEGRGARRWTGEAATRPYHASHVVIVGAVIVGTCR